MLNAFARTGLSLDGKWRVIVEPYKNGFFDQRPPADEMSSNLFRGTPWALASETRR